MQFYVKNALNNVFETLIFKELRNARRPLVNVIPLPSCFMVFIFIFITNMGYMSKGFTVIESSSGTRPGDPLGGLLFTLAHC
jgi:hypothetical protein